MCIQELYKLVFANSQIVSPYYIYTVAPRSLISPNRAATTSQLQLNESVLVIEERDDVPDLLELFNEVFTCAYLMHDISDMS